MTRDEIAVLEKESVCCSCEVSGRFSRTSMTSQHQNYKYTSDYDKRLNFDIEQFLDHRLKLKADDAYEVVDAEK